MSPFTGTQSHDFNLQACTAFALADWKTQEPKNAHVKALLGQFRYNIVRVRMMIVLPAQAAALGMDMRGWLDMAELELTGALAGAHSPEMSGKIKSRMSELSRDHVGELSKLQGTPQWDKFVRERIDAGLAPVRLMATAAAAESGLDALLSSCINGTWTAFETMAGDLWEIALNEHPSDLANLNGKSARLGKDKAGVTTDIARRDGDEPKGIPLDLIQECGFDIKDKMGTVLRRRFDFARLTGIRRAYAAAFSKGAAAVDKALRSSALDSLSVVRNLLVHKAGSIDAEYLRRAKGLAIPTAPIGNHLLLDGEMVVGLIKPAIETGAELIEAVDTWLDKNK
jgi:hypothetical protein